MSTKLGNVELLKFLLTVETIKELSSKTTLPIIQDDTIEQIVNDCDCYGGCKGGCDGSCMDSCRGNCDGQYQ